MAFYPINHSGQGRLSDVFSATHWQPHSFQTAVISVQIAHLQYTSLDIMI